MEYFETKDTFLATERVYRTFQDNLRKHFILDGAYREDDVWNLMCYKADLGLTFDSLIQQYEKSQATSQVGVLFNALRFGCATSHEDLAKEAPETQRKRIENTYPETPLRKPVTVKVNVDLYYEIDTKNLPVWMNGDAIAKAVEGAFEDAGPANWGSFTNLGVLKQAPSEVIINHFDLDHQ
jgi:hypothetical protein